MVLDLVPSYAPNTDLFFKREFRIPAAQDNEVEMFALPLRVRAWPSSKPAFGLQQWHDNLKGYNFPLGHRLYLWLLPLVKAGD